MSLADFRPRRLPDGRVPPEDADFALVEDVYRAFAAPPPPDLGVCNCAMCIGKGTEAALLAKPIRDWSLSDVYAWQGSVLRRMDRRLWSWLLPRFLEILLAGESVTNGPEELALSAYPTGQRENWPDRQWQVLDRVAERLLDHGVTRRTGPGFLEPVCILTNGGWPLDDLIARVSAHPQILGAMAYTWGIPAWHGDLFGPGWPNGAEDALLAAFATQEWVDRLMAYALAPGQDTDRADEALNAAEALQKRL